jgi:hypothetical protein
MKMKELTEIAENQKWFEFISTLRPYLNKKQESPIFELNAILSTFILESEQSINSIPKDSIKQEKRVKLSKLYQAYNLATQSMGIQVIYEQKNLRQQVRLNELETTLIELASENKLLKDKLEFYEK